MEPPPPRDPGCGLRKFRDAAFGGDKAQRMRVSGEWFRN